MYVSGMDGWMREDEMTKVNLAADDDDDDDSVWELSSAISHLRG